jgi:predicted histone-like DNA-binding protein
MPIQYKLIERGEPGIKGGGERYQRPSLVVNKTISPDEFCSLMVEKIRFSTADVHAFLYAMQELLRQQLAEGNIVQPRFMGSFYPSLKYKGGKGEDLVNKENIIPRINYRPTQAMKKAMKNAELRKVKG